MQRSYKTEINPTPEQMQIIHKTIGTCRFVYNFYLAYNKEMYEKEHRFVSGMDFSKWLNNVYLKENPDTHIIKSGTISCHAGRYYVSVLVEEPEKEKPSLTDSGIGVDVGVKDFMIASNGMNKKNINRTAKVRKLEKQLKREQRSLSRKYEGHKKRSTKQEGGATRQNIQKQQLKVQTLHQRINNIRTDYVNKCVSELVKTKPAYITIEDLNVSGMMRNRHLSKAVASQKFYEFRTKLEAKCKENGIEFRVADRWYPSSKVCHGCGRIKHNLKLSDRIYICECGYRADRDFNASLNLRDVKTYKIA
ncbi:MAG: transposase [Lachnospiraceae bacterium]|nr:transposase [Lachnospiraceae bacterium]